MRTFSKPAIDVQAQVELLRHRGLAIEDETRAESFLQSVSYFRLSPYMRPFQIADDRDHRFRDDSQFNQLTRLYDFDRRLRLLTLDAIERVEVASRSVISNHMGPTHGSHWYINPQMFHHTFDHQRLLTTLSLKQSTALRDYQKECERIDRSQTDTARKERLKRQRAKDSYARHYPMTYASPALMPGWAMLEELTLGDLADVEPGAGNSPPSYRRKRTSLGRNISFSQDRILVSLRRFACSIT
ncbi:Abi family protein [Pseudomonas trivialis]|uniref:Abi-like protein n=1 Tax=Pseudomonas trivialis TaxID=200450 RepID=A0ABY0U0R3_9PSED|nr:Abi family protein [Pseudomonas trivialis]SDR87330.1 Abi-like protein [Pseudomonas trivialis]